MGDDEIGDFIKIILPTSVEQQRRDVMESGNKVINSVKYLFKHWRRYLTIFVQVVRVYKLRYRGVT